MSTATATAQRPFVLKPHQVTLELIPALPEDLKEFDCWVDLGEGNSRKKMKLKSGMIFWLKSPSTLEIIQTPYILTERTSLEDLKEWFDNNMIYIAKNPFK